MTLQKTTMCFQAPVAAGSAPSTADTEHQTSKSQKRVTKMMAMVMGSYYILYAPAITNEYMKTSPIAEKVRPFRISEIPFDWVCLICLKTGY